MLDQLIKLVEQNAGKDIIQNKAIPDQHNQAAIKAVAEQIFNGLKSQASAGNIQQIASMLQGGKALGNNPIVNQLITSAANTVATKFGVSPQVAQNMAKSLLPTVMNQLITKTNDPKDNSFDLGGIMKTVTGNNSFDVGSILGKTASGGLGDMLGGMFGKK
ncbi:MAG: hypothetical protein ACOYW3_02260 [Bacteroidota bacterium]